MDLSLCFIFNFMYRLKT